MKKKAGSLIFLIALLGLLGIYAGALNNGFHLDDYHHIVHNPYLKTLSNIPLYFTDPQTFSTFSGLSHHYRPLVLTSHSINYWVGGLNPVGYHLVNLAFHGGSAFLVFLIVRALLTGPGISERVGMDSPLFSSRDFSAMAASLIFLATPFNTEVVNYISARSSVMSAFFYLLAFWCWVKYRESGNPLVGSSLPPGARGSGWGGISAYRYYIASLLTFLLSMLSKEIAITLPVVLWLYDLYFSGSRANELSGPSTGLRAGSRLFHWPSYLPYLPFALIGLTMGVLVRWMTFGAVLGKNSPRDLLDHSLTQIHVYGKYIVHMILPVGLSLDHPLSHHPSFWDPPVFLSAGLLLGGVIGAVYCWKKGGAVFQTLGFFWWWFLVALLPMALVRLVALYQENRGYLAVVGLAAMAGILIEHAIQFLSRSPKWKRRLGLSLLVTLLAFYGIGVWERNQDWQDEKTIWSDTLRKNPRSEMAHIKLGEYYQRLGEVQMAAQEFLTALEINHYNGWALTQMAGLFDQIKDEEMAEDLWKRLGQFSLARIGLARLYFRQNRLDEAEMEILHLLDLNATDMEATQLLIVISKRQGRLQEMKRRYERLVAHSPANPANQLGFGLVAHELRDWDRAINAYQKVLRIYPEAMDVLLNLGGIYQGQGRLDLVEGIYQQAIQTNPGNPLPYQTLGIFYQQQGRHYQALKAYEEVLTLYPRAYQVYNNMGLIYLEQGKREEAVRAFKKALEIKPDYLQAQENLKRVYGAWGLRGG